MVLQRYWEPPFQYNYLWMEIKRKESSKSNQTNTNGWYHIDWLLCMMISVCVWPFFRPDLPSKRLSTLARRDLWPLWNMQWALNDLILYHVPKHMTVHTENDRRNHITISYGYGVCVEISFVLIGHFVERGVFFELGTKNKEKKVSSQLWYFLRTSQSHFGKIFSDGYTLRIILWISYERASFLISNSNANYLEKSKVGRFSKLKKISFQLAKTRSRWVAP